MTFSPDTRKCYSCKRVLPLYCFHKPTINGGHYKSCIICMRSNYLSKEYEDMKNKLLECDLGPYLDGDKIKLDNFKHAD